MILLWGISGDTPIDAVQEELQRQGSPLLRIEQRLAGRITVDLTVDREVRGRVSVQGHQVALSDIDAAYLRPYDTRQIPSIRAAGPASRLWRQALAADEALLTWCELTGARVVNRPSAMSANNSKPLQLAAIAKSGFSVPETIVTNNLEALENFRERHRRIIYKSISGVRSVVSTVEEALGERAVDLATCPTQFQEFIEGIEHRIHVVGDDVFACAIHCAATDYRYASPKDLEATAVSLPAELQQRCRDMVRSMGLWLAGIDLRVTARGDWYCFEVNPSPAFTYFEELTGQPITAAVASLLSRGSALEKRSSQPAA